MKPFLLALFGLVALVQLYVPASMIIDKENVIRNGQVVKFKTAPVDPNDPFRGKYIDLQFEAVNFSLPDKSQKWTRQESVFVVLQEDENGFVTIHDVKKEKPDDGLFVKAKVLYGMPYNDPDRILIEYPFERFYMEESKAYDAEVTYRNSLQDTASTTYALVHILDGKAVLTDVMIDGRPILELLEMNSGF